MTEKKDKQYIEKCKVFIEAIGRKQIRTECGISLQNLNYWLVRGIPKSWLHFLCEKHKEEAHIFQEKV